MFKWEKETQQWIIARGNLENGFVFTGPFDSYKKAHDYDNKYRALYSPVGNVEMICTPIKE